MNNEKGFTLIELVFALILIPIIILGLGIWIYGYVLAFSASIIIGLVLIFLPPLPFVFGIVGICGLDIAMAIQNWLHLPI